MTGPATWQGRGKRKREGPRASADRVTYWDYPKSNFDVDLKARLSWCGNRISGDGRLRHSMVVYSGAIRILHI